MHEILPNQLWIGNAGDGRDAARLLRAGVAAVVNLAAEESSPALPRGMIYYRLPIMDGERRRKRPRLGDLWFFSMHRALPAMLPSVHKRFVKCSQPVSKQIPGDF